MKLELADLSKRYGTRWALARVSFSVEAGESVMLSGHNGSGKTTLLRVAAGATQPSLGDCVLGGVSLKADRDFVRRNVALLSHASGHYDDLSAGDNLRVHARYLKRDKRAVADALERTGLSARAENAVRDFSAGMKKRLAIARVMLKAPPLILLDEPFGELDPQAMDMVEKWIADETHAGRTVILATHWLEQGRRLTKRTISLRDGRVEKPQST